jgi:hypothetical protein
MLEADLHMTDSESPDPPSVQKAAATLASTLGGYDESAEPLDKAESILTPVQHALIYDSFGLLNGIASGLITISQPRIRDNLVEVIRQLPDGSRHDAAGGLASLLSTVISKAGSCGLTAQDQPLGPTRNVRRGRS